MLFLHTILIDKRLNTQQFIEAALLEDVGNGDYSTLASIPADAKGMAVLKIKENGIIAGLDLAEEIFYFLEPGATITLFKKDGDKVSNGETAFEVSAGVHTILKAERLVLNCMQRMSGIATLTSKFVEAVKGTNAKILDTRKTTPNLRYFEKWAVRIGGGHNHRFGLYDMIMLKDNHIDFSGGITKAINAVKEYQQKNGLELRVEVETRTIKDVEEILSVGGIHRIMFDNFTVEDMKRAVQLVNGKYETEASGGITLQTIRPYAETGVDFVSVGALTHSAGSLDLSLKAFE